MALRQWTLIFALLVPAFSGCVVLGQPDEWDLTLSVGVLVSTRERGALDDVLPAAELAATSLTASDAGIRVLVAREETADAPTAAFDRLVQKKVAVVVAAVAPAEGTALLRRAAQAKVPVILVTPVEGAPTAADAAYGLVLAPPARAEADALARLLVESGAPSVTVLRPDHSYGAATAAALAAAYPDVVAQARFTSLDAGSALTAGRNACASGARAVVILGHPEDAGQIARGLTEGRCRAEVGLFAGALARQPDFPAAAGRWPNNTNLAMGTIGVEPRGARLPEFRSIFEAEHNRAPGAFAAEAYDAVVLAALAAFHAHGSEAERPVEATVTAAKVQSSLLPVAEAPGEKQLSVSAAVASAKSRDELDFLGYAHDYDFTDARLPEAGAWSTWSVTMTGGIQSGHPLG